MATKEFLAVPSAAGPARVPPSGAFARNRELLAELVRRDVRARYRGSALGVLWTLLNPILFMTVYTVVFSVLLGATYPGGVPAAAYILTGLLVWNFFSQAVSFATSSVLSNSGLVRKVAFPWVLLTVSAVTAALVNYLISLVLLVPIFIIFKLPLSLALVMLPVLVVIPYVLALGVGLLLAAGNVYFRDLEHLVQVGLLVWLYLTPIVYPPNLVAAHDHGLGGHIFSFFFRFNPMTWVVRAMEDVITRGLWPLHWHGLVYAGVAAVTLLGCGVVVFHRARRRFAEEV
ncbi:MAG TPA: ABC transporter permease [Verrucomicrobiae bacterium]|nr:ABC transporter permease [Verrucomicrobiae bacterium]